LHYLFYTITFSNTFSQDLLLDTVELVKYGSNQNT